MKADIYVAFYDYSSGLGWWRSALIRVLTFSKVNHVGLIFCLPFSNISPMVLDGSKCRLLTEFMLEQKGAILIYKKYMGSVDTCLEDIKRIAETHKVWTWYKVLLWFLIGRWFGIKAHHCGTLAANWLNTNLKFNYRHGSIPHRFMQEVKNDYSSYWW
jgi:hypothetical protein